MQHLITFDNATFMFCNVPKFYTPRLINFPFVPNRKLFNVAVPILKRFMVTVLFCLRNRFLLTAICWPIYHWLAVSREVNISRAQSTSDIFTEVYFISNTQETTKRQMYPSEVASFPPLHE